MQENSNKLKQIIEYYPDHFEDQYSYHFSPLCFSLTSDRFVQSQYLQQFTSQQNSNSERSYDYPESSNDEEHYNQNIDEDFLSSQIDRNQQFNHYPRYFRDEYHENNSNQQLQQSWQILKQGLSVEEINSLPTMKWNQSHNTFNKQEKCSICFEEFHLDNTLRIMSCFHRYHMDCLDKWLLLKASCPSCRNKPNDLDQQ